MTIDITKLPSEAIKLYRQLLEQGKDLGLSMDEIELAFFASGEFNRGGFKAFFHFMHGSPVHREGEKWVDNIFDTIEFGNRKLLQEAFRGSGKTTVFSKFFLAYFIGHHPYTTNIVFRINTEKANETTSEVADLIARNDRWNMMFPGIVPDYDTGWGEKKGYFIIDSSISRADWLRICAEHTRPNGATLIGYGYGSGSAIGSRPSGILLVDDIHDRENTSSDRRISQVKEFVREVMLPMSVPDQTVEIWNYTPWNKSDAYAERKATSLYNLSKSPVFTEAEPNEEGAVYWPEEFQHDANPDFKFPFADRWWHFAWEERWGIKEIAEVYMDIGHTAFSRMYLLDLAALDGQVLKGDWIQYYPYDQIGREWKTVMGIDYASVSDKLKHKDRDYFALAIGKLIPGGGIVLVDGYIGHLTKGEALNKVVSMVGKYPNTQIIGVENIGKGEEYYNDLVMVDDIHGMPLNLLSIKHGRQSKSDRFEGWLGKMVMAGRIKFSDESFEYRERFINEWLSFPHGSNDDAIDGVYMMAWAAQGYMMNTVSQMSRMERKKVVENPWFGFGRGN
jgi:phage terminase large subunit-like protein